MLFNNRPSLRLIAALVLTLASAPARSQPLSIDAKFVPTDHPLILLRGATPPLPPRAAAIVEALNQREQAVRAQMEARLAEERAPLIQRLEALVVEAEQGGAAEQAEAIRGVLVGLRPAPAASDVQPDPGTLVSYRGQVGKTLRFTVTGRSSGTVWGNGIYTDDSPLATAAVHAGLLKVGETGTVRVTIQPGLPAYVGITQNGVTSAEYADWSGSYTVAPDPIAGYKPIGVAPPMQPLHSYGAIDGDAVNANLPVGAFYIAEVTGATNGSIWGDGVYTTDSSLATAAVHSGALKDGEHAVVRVTIVPGQPSYEGVSRNGVTSRSWQSWEKSFIVQKLVNEPSATVGKRSAGPIDDVRLELPTIKTQPSRPEPSRRDDPNAE